VAKWNGLTFDKFIELEGDEQSRLVAAYETSMMIEAVAVSENNRKQNAKKRNTKRI